MLASGKVECEKTIDGSFRQIRHCLSVFLSIWNAPKASLSFGGATNSEFAEILLRFPTEEPLQPMR